MEAPQVTYQTRSPDSNAYITYQVGLTHREWQTIKQLRRWANAGKQLAVIEFTEAGPCVREVGKREG